jgi:hypothetical protein
MVETLNRPSLLLQGAGAILALGFLGLPISLQILAIKSCYLVLYDGRL